METTTTTRRPGRPRASFTKEEIIAEYTEHGYRILHGEAVAGGGVPPEEMPRAELTALARQMDKEKSAGWRWADVKR